VLSLQSSRARAWPSALPFSLLLRWMRRPVRRGMERRMLPSKGAEKGWKPVQPVRPISSRLVSSHLTSPHLTSPHLTSPHLTSPHLTSPHLTSPDRTLPHSIWCSLHSSHLTCFSSHLLFSYFDNNVCSGIVCSACSNLTKRADLDGIITLKWICSML